MKSDTATTGPGRSLERARDVGQSAARRPGAGSCARRPRAPSRRSSVHDVTDQTSACDVPVVLRAAAAPRSAHGTATPEASSCALAAVAVGGRGAAVHAAQDALDVDVLRLGRLHVRLVVDGEVVEDRPPASLAVHPAQAVPDDVRRSRSRTPGRRRRTAGLVDASSVRVAVLVLQALAVERRAAGGGAEHEAAGHLVGGRPERVAGPLEPEHRVEDVDRDHRLAVRRVRRADRGERRRPSRPR